MTQSLEVVPVALAPSEAAARLRDRPGLTLLDSGGDGERARYSYLTSDPVLTITSHGRRVVVTEAGQARAQAADPWPVVRAAWRRYRRAAVAGLPPFQGGFVGYWAYDLGRHLERLPAGAADDLGLPDLDLGLHDWVLAHDHATGQGWLLCTGLPDGTPAAARARRDEVLGWLARPPADEPVPPRPPAPPRFRSRTGRAAYLRAVARARAYIAAGDIYQVCLSHRLDAAWAGDPWHLYERLRRTAPVPFGAYLARAGGAVLSASPELFLRLDGAGRVETRPIKGTRPRGRTAAEDARLAAALLGSEKDRAENVMIVDLLRNDLGRVCEIGSVRVPDLCRLEGYSHVWQLVSTVTGRLRADRDALDLLSAGFPGGSVTGCPKIRAMEIIDELEPVRRGLYCGAIGYLGLDGALETSIVIRTLLATPGRLSLHVGGAVTADSDPAAEYAETLAKAAAGLAAAGATLEEW